MIKTCTKQCTKTTQRRDLKSCTNLHYTYHLQCKFKDELQAKRYKAQRARNMNILVSSNVRELLNVEIWNFAHIFIPTIYNASSKMSCKRSDTKRSELAIWIYLYQAMCENYSTYRSEILNTSLCLQSTMPVRRWVASEASQSVASSLFAKPWCNFCWGNARVHLYGLTCTGALE